MAPIVAGGIIRFSVVAELLGQTCINIVDVDLDTDVGTTRSEEAFSIAGDIINNWDDHVMGNLVSDYTALRVDWVDLDSLNGSVGSRSVTSDTTWPAAGRATGNAMPGHTYARIRKNIQGGGRQSRRGVLRLSGLPESYVSGNNILTENVTGLNAAFEQFKDGINGSPSSSVRNLAVVHVPASGPVSSSHISTYSCDSVVGTIRRRMPGYGT